MVQKRSHVVWVGGDEELGGGAGAFVAKAVGEALLERIRKHQDNSPDFSHDRESADGQARWRIERAYSVDPDDLDCVSAQENIEERRWSFRYVDKADRTYEVEIREEEGLLLTGRLKRVMNS